MASSRDLTSLANVNAYLGLTDGKERSSSSAG
jgi:hypothetical protein